MSYLDILELIPFIKKFSSGGSSEIAEDVEALKTGLQAEATQRSNADIAINERIGTVELIAKGANQAVSFASYSALVTSLNAEADTKYRSGQNLMVITLEVPDLWVSGVAETSVPYTYVDDETFLEDMADSTSYGGAGKIQVGYYVLSQLETQKVNLDDYLSKSEYDNAFDAIGGGCKIDTTTTWSSGLENTIIIQANHMHRVINPIVADEDAYFFTMAPPAKSDVTAEYLLDFSTGAIAPIVWLPSAVTFVPAFVPQANKRYQISIMDGIGLWVESDAPAVTEND